MSAVRIYDGRICRKYRVYVAIVAVIFTFQLILAYSIYKINSVDDDEQLSLQHQWRPDDNSVAPADKEVGALSGVIQRYPDDDLTDDDDFGEAEAKLYGRRQNTGYIQPDKLRFADTIPKPVVVQLVSVKQTSFIAKNNHSNVTAHSQLVVTKTAFLNLSELAFKPACDIVAKEAISAINRASSQSCKQELANITCLDQANKLYPNRLPRYCPSKGRKTGEYLACYRDDKNNRVLRGSFNILSKNSPQRCVDLCLRSGFPLAGVQYGSECFCGDDYPSAKLLLPETDCDKLCPGDTSTMCGGYFALNLYHTGISKVPKIKYESTSAPNVTLARVLYLLSVNGRAVRQVRRLIKALYHVNSYFFIHVDVRQDYMFRELLPLETRFANVRLSRRRLSTIWGGSSLLLMILESMEEALSRTDWKWDFFINLSESDFPIKTHKELTSFLTANKGKNFLKSHGKDTQRFITKQGLDKTFHECGNRMWLIGSRQLPFGVRVDGGSDWVAISRDFAHYAVFNTSELVTGLKRIYKQTLLPAESFFHTLLRNSEFCDSFVDNNLHVTNWKRKVGCHCQYRHIVDWCGCSPNVFKPDDWTRIRSSDSRPFYFARKFEPIINQAIIDQLETWLYGPPPNDLPGSTSYWQNEYHYNDTSPAVSDALYSAYLSFSRLSVNLLEDLVRKCKLKPSRVLEATLFNENDLFKGILVLFETISEHDDAYVETVLLETQVQPRHFYEVVRSIGPTGRLKSLQVGTLCDQKEQLFRNFGNVMGPDAEVCLLHKWGEGEEFVATFVWVDPAATVASSYEVNVTAGAHVSFHKPKFRQLLRPGTWTLKLMYRWRLVAQTKFLIVPLSHEARKEIARDRARLLNGGKGKKKYVDEDFANVEKLLGYGDDRRTELLSAEENGRLYGDDLLKWIDGLVSQFYVIQDTCYVQVVSKSSSPGQSCSSLVLDPCSEVQWSSRFPDPKSVIGKVSGVSGRLEW